MRIGPRTAKNLLTKCFRIAEVATKIVFRTKCHMKYLWFIVEIDVCGCVVAENNKNGRCYTHQVFKHEIYS